jgi:hypothetical protein
MMAEAEAEAEVEAESGVGVEAFFVVDFDGYT